jgi:putative transposase
MLKINGGKLLLNINKTIKIRLYPTNLQRELLNKTFGCCRLLWNQMLAERNKVYQCLKEDSEALRANKYKTEKEYKQEFKFMTEVDSKALQSTTRHLLDAFQNFFRGLKEGRKVGYPRFKSKKNKQAYTTYNINNNIRIDFDRKRIKLPKIKTWINYKDNRRFAEPIRHVTVSKTKSGKYQVSILIEEELSITPLTEVHFDDITAFDMSASEFLVGEGEVFSNPRFYRSSEAKLRKLHRQVSRKKKGSQNRGKARLRLACFYEKIAYQKYDWTHKIALKLVNTCDAVILEDLNIKGMQQFNSGVSKSVTLDFSWHQFKTILKYKLEWRGKHYQEVDRFFPSSKPCSACGYKNKNLTLDEREWACPECGACHHRDENASINIKIEGIRLLEEKGITVIS